MCLEQSGCARQNMPPVEWCTYTLHPQTTTNISELHSHGIIQNQDFAQYDHTNSNHVEVRRVGTCRTDTKLPFQVLPGGQVRSDLSSYLQSETTKSIRSSQTISTIQPLPGTIVFTTAGLDGQARSESSLFPRSDRTTASQVPETELSSRHTSATTASNDLFAVRSLFGTQNFCLDNQLGRRISEESQNPVRSLLGRFPPSKSVKDAVKGRHRIHDKHTAFTRLDDQLRKICSGSDTMPRVSWHNMGHKTQHKVLVGTEVLNATQSTSSTASKKQVVPQTVSKSNGETQLCNIRNSERSPALSYSAILQPTTARETPIPAHDYPSTCSVGDGVVVPSYRKVYADTLKRSDTPADNRCVRHRLGCPTRRHKYYGDLGRFAAGLACQQERNVRRLCCDTPESTSTPECTDTITNRQSHGSLIYKQGGWHQIQEASSTDSTTSGNSRQTEHSSDSALFPGQIQCRSRCSVSAENLSRVASHEVSNEENLSNVGHAGDRSVRIENSSHSTKICIIGRRRSGSATPQRVLSSVALQPSLVVPASESDTQSSQTLEPEQRGLHIDCPEVEQGILAGRRSTASSTSPLSNSRSSTRSYRYQNGDASATSARPTLGGMADFGWPDMLTEWTDQEQQLLMSSWRCSTINTYKPAWRRWRQWCESRSIDYKYPTPDQVARFLAYLHCDIGLAYRTILVHKSVISTFTHLTGNINLSTNFFIKHVLRAISVAREKPAKPPIWNPKVLLQYMSSYNFNENNIYQVSRHVATLLLLASGRRVHDLTLLRVDSTSLVDQGTSIVLWPVFGSKTDSHNHRQSGWRLREHPDKKLNLIYWLRQLLHITVNRRKNLNHLFITARGDIKPASRTVIGGWVRSLLKASGIDATPGSVRSAVASLNFVENFPIDQILATSNWKMIHTFQNYYQRELITHNDSNFVNNSVSLSNYFDAVK